jgi:hypothetical protein
MYSPPVYGGMYNDGSQPSPYHHPGHPGPGMYQPMYQSPPPYGVYGAVGAGGYYGYSGYQPQQQPPPPPRSGGGGNSSSLTPEPNNPELLHHQHGGNEKQSVDSQSQNSKSPEEELEEVKPIQTDFHCFVLEWKDKLLREAEAEVDASLQGYDNEYKAQNRLYLLNSNLNCRLMKKWEDFTMDEREDYFQKEEDDRRRFMTEDEVISRHCFTLTARVRSPTKRNSSSNNNSDDESLGDRHEKRPLQPSEPSPTSLTDEETPPKKTRGAKDGSR